MCHGRRRGLALVCLLATSASAQFGNLEVKWDSSSAGSHPRVEGSSGRSQEGSSPEDERRRGLPDLPIAALKEIVAGLGASCDACTTHGHWVSRVRSACLEVSHYLHNA